MRMRWRESVMMRKRGLVRLLLLTHVRCLHGLAHRAKVDQAGSVAVKVTT
jgi:hypothetical protein